MVQMLIPSLHDIDDAAAKMLKQLNGRKKVAFQGEMGSGKTTLIKALCRELGVVDGMNSPTFALINEYFTLSGNSIFHFDLYRIEDVMELYDIGYEDYFFSDAYCFIEWPEKAPELIPDHFVYVFIKVMEDDGREITFTDK